MPVQPQNRPPMDYGVPPPPARSGMVPPPPMATPFMPGAVSAPPPALNPMAPPPMTSPSSAEASQEVGGNAMMPTHSRKGMTAAQLYSLNAIGNGNH